MIIEHLKMVVGDQLIDSSDGARIDSVNPFNQEVWSTIPAATAEDVEKAYSVARSSFDTHWSRTSGAERGRLMRKLAEALIDRAPEMGRMETIDNGKVIRETERQMHFAARNYEFLSGYADKLYGNTIPLDQSNLFDFTTREPAGVAGLLVAWNSPIQLLTNKLAPALCAGCTVVVKPSEYASATTLKLAEIALEVGFPPGVFNVITGAATAGRAMSESRNVDKISFTGGPETGALVAAAAAKNLVPVTLELGGKSPHIIFEDADLDSAISGAQAGIFGAAGQSCISGSRLLVQRSVYDRVVATLTERTEKIRLGDPLSPDTEMGPVANQAQFDRIMGLIEKGVLAGAKVTTGGETPTSEETKKGFFIQPTVFADVDNNMEIAQKEIFGPVLSVIPFTDEADAVRIANNTDFGLASGVWTKSLSRAHRVARSIRAGTVWVNTYRTNAAQAPFGGFKSSGYGRERGLESVDAYLKTRNVMIDLNADVGDPFAMRV